MGTLLRDVLRYGPDSNSHPMAQASRISLARGKFGRSFTLSRYRAPVARVMPVGYDEAGSMETL
jgi:hypothetical protein